MRREAAPAPIGSDELAEGLMLVRESTLKIIRFQLAMERRDRRVALQAVDDLVVLDRRLQDYLRGVPSAELDVERAALNREKLILAAEVIRAEPKLAAVASEPAAIEPAPLEPSKDLAIEEERPNRAAWWLVAILLLLSVAAAAAYWFAGAGLTGIVP